MTLESSAGHAQYKLPLHFVAGAYTTGTVDALAHVRGHVWMAEVFFSVQMMGPFGIAHRPYSDLCGYGLQLTVVVHLAGEAIQRVVGEDQLDYVFAQLKYFFARWINVTVGHCGCMATGDGAG